LLFLHGRGRSKEDWKEYFSTLERKAVAKHPEGSGISYFALDLPGFGGSQLPGDVRGVREYSEFVLQFLAKLNVSQPVEIVAHSFGGRVAFYLAAKYPERVRRLWLMAPGGVEKGTSKVKKWMFSVGTTLLPQQVQHYVKRRMGSVDYKNAGKLAPIFKKVVNEDLRALFLQIFQPVQLYW